MNNPKLVSVNSLAPIYTEDAQVVSFQRTTEAVICAHSVKTRTSGVILLRDVDAQALGQFLARVGQGSPIQDLIVKIVGSPQQVDKMQEAVKRQGVSQVRAYTAQTTRVQGFFYTDSARMRVSEVGRELKSPITTKASSPATSNRKQRVLIVDDSKTIRQVLHKILTASPQLEVIGEAERPSQVLPLLQKLKPDVMTLDINMPEMTGVELLGKLFPENYIPTVMISSVSLTEGHQVMQALELGAVDYIQKPEFNEIAKLAPTIQSTVYNAAFTNQKARRKKSPDLFNKVGSLDTSKFIAIGASTGGTEAIKTLFQHFPADCPPIGVVQHIPPYFSTAFAHRLNEICQFEVREAKEGDIFEKGLALIAPGGKHLEVENKNGVWRAKISDAPPVNRFKPSVDVFFHSVAKSLGKQASGVLLTGMGDDGARGMLKLKETGALTIAESEASCVVFGMPRAAIEMGAATVIADLEEIASHLPSGNSLDRTA